MSFASAGKFRRTSGPTYARPNDTWEHLAMGLCLPSGTSLPTTSSFYSNFASVSKSDHAFCSRLQPTNDDYKVNQNPTRRGFSHLTLVSLTRDHPDPNHRKSIWVNLTILG